MTAQVTARHLQEVRNDLAGVRLLDTYTDAHFEALDIIIAEMFGIKRPAPPTPPKAPVFKLDSWMFSQWEKVA